MTSPDAIPVAAAGNLSGRYVVAADRVFDGTRMLERHAVAVSGDRIEAVVPSKSIGDDAGVLVEFPGTLLPGLIDLHAHLRLGQVPPDIVLRHGLTTIRDTGGPLLPPEGGDGRLRVLAAGPILTAPGGYPIPVFGPASGLEVPDADAARKAVSELARGGAAFIKIALEPGGSTGAPWTMHQPTTPPPWPVLPLEVVRAIVSAAHQHGLIVAAHLSGPEGAELALDGGVDEWAHVPCDPIPPWLIERAASAGVQVVGTLDTLSHCTGVFGNARLLAEAGIALMYGTDLAHTDVPWGIDAQELELMVHTAAGLRTPLDVLAAATARAGEHLGLAPLGQLIPGAPADLIGVRGDPLRQFKTLEYPDLIVSGGIAVVESA